MNTHFRTNCKNSLSYKGDGFPRTPCSGRTTNSVNVVLEKKKRSTFSLMNQKDGRSQSANQLSARVYWHLGVSGDVIVYDAVHVWNVQTSGRHISRQEN